MGTPSWGRRLSVFCCAKDLSAFMFCAGAQSHESSRGRLVSHAAFRYFAAQKTCRHSCFALVRKATNLVGDA